MIGFRTGAATDIGRVRTLNEDSLATGEVTAAVADGMGGHQGGEVASATAIAHFEGIDEPLPLAELARRISDGNTEVLALSGGSTELAGMGTTLCAVAVTGEGDRVAVVNVGDSRVYVRSGQELAQLTEDHSFVETLVREGRLTRAQADSHPQRNVLTRALGVEPAVEIDGWEYVPDVGDRFLLCSDGLFNEVADTRIDEILSRPSPPEEAARALVDEAVESGGRDNVTCVVVDVVNVDGVAAATGLPVADRLTRLMGATAQTPPAPLAATVAAPTAAGADSGAKPRRLNSWRVWMFVAALLATVGIAIGAVAWYANRTYTVAIEGDEVVIFEGPRGGLLWFDPEVIGQDIAVDDLADESQIAALRTGVRQSSRDDAAIYVAKLKLLSEQTTTTTSTTTTTTTTTTSTTVAAGGEIDSTGQ